MDSKDKENEGTCMKTQYNQVTYKVVKGKYKKKPVQKSHIMYRKIMTAVYLLKIIQARRERSNIFKAQKKGGGKKNLSHQKT